jgi:hypothetical protein
MKSINLSPRTLSSLRNPIAADSKSKSESKAAPKQVALKGGWGYGGVQLGQLFCSANVLWRGRGVFYRLITILANAEVWLQQATMNKDKRRFIGMSYGM